MKKYLYEKRQTMDDKEKLDASEEANGSTGGRKFIFIKLLFFLLFIAGVIFLFSYTDIGKYFERSYIEKNLEALGPWQAAVAFMVIYAVATLLAVPGTILTLLGGAIFGKWLGTGLIIIGATIGATLAFFMSRFLARDFIVNKFSRAKWFSSMDRGIEEDGIWFILFIRLVPVFPFNGINYAAGLTKIKVSDYILGTTVGIIPATFIYANAASEATMAVESRGVTLGLIISLLLLGALAIVPIIYKRYKRNKNDNGVE